MNETKTYIGTKVLKATPMNRADYNIYRNWTLPDDEDGTDTGYLVEYTDGGKPNHPDHKGYISWSPEDVFKKAYRQISDRKMDFSEALRILKAGGKVALEGSDVWLEVTDGQIKVVVLHEGDGDEIIPGISREVWKPTQDTLLAEDWTVVT